MKKLFFLLLICLTTSCKNEIVKKPKNFIDKEKMETILYDLALLDAVKAQNGGNAINYPKSVDYIKNKYHIDSLTFVENTKYYAADVKEFKNMYANIKERLTKESTKINNGKPLNPVPENGVVK